MKAWIKLHAGYIIRASANISNQFTYFIINIIIYFDIWKWIKNKSIRVFCTLKHVTIKRTTALYHKNPYLILTNQAPCRGSGLMTYANSNAVDSLRSMTSQEFKIWIQFSNLFCRSTNKLYKTRYWYVYKKC